LVALNLKIRVMKRFAVLLMAVLLVAGCQEMEIPTDLTGYETTYELVAASTHDVKGIVTFKERKDGFTNVVISLNGTAGSAKHPVHLHLGDITTPDAEIAAQLNPVAASTGMSETLLNSLADETPITYTGLMSLKASIKIHLSDSGPEREIVLAGGNVGQSYVEAISDGKSKSGVSNCKGG
jgi:hypothetical protein